jgi:hypothetical protein
MPGPERLAGEGILMGAIPIVSSRWNGASYVDFPGILKVDHQNQSDIEYKVKYAIENYHKLITDENNIVFYSYIKSMWKRITDTADVVFASSRIHFVVFVRNLEDEHKATLQCLALLYLFPLASIDVYVIDIYWFMRHHYKFYTILKNAGYIRYDPHNPTENKYMSDNNNLGRSFVNIRQFTSMDDILDSLSSYQNIPWKPLIVFMPVGVLFSDPYSLLQSIHQLDINAPGVLEADDFGLTLTLNSCTKKVGNPIMVLVQPSVSFDNVKHIIYSIANEPYSDDDQVCNNDFTILGRTNNSSFTTVCRLYHKSSNDFTSIHNEFVSGVTKSPSWHSLMYSLDHSESIIC